MWLRPGQCGLVAWTLSCKQKGHGFNSQSGRMPELQFWSPFGTCVRGNVSLSHQCFSPCFLPPFPSLWNWWKKKKIFLMCPQQLSALFPIPLHPQHNSLFPSHGLCACCPIGLWQASPRCFDGLHLHFMQISIQISHLRKSFPDQHSLSLPINPFTLL